MFLKHLQTEIKGLLLKRNRNWINQKLLNFIISGIKRLNLNVSRGARCSSVIRAFAHGAMGRRIDPSWSGPIELFLVLASVPRLV